MGALENALSDCFNYHNALDAFVERAGLPHARMASIRKRAEDEYKARSGNFSRAPKRIIVLALLRDLGSAKPDDDRIIADLITSLCRGTFREATDAAKSAIDELKAERVEEGREAAERRAERERQQRDQERARERAGVLQATKRASFRETFLQISDLEPQHRGYRLETFLNEFFEFEGLDPRGSFRNLGEQIDGSFSSNGRTHLVEGKWVKDPVAGAEFGAFMFKIEGKSADTRGLYISINGYSPEALKALQTKGEARFICIDGTHLMRSMEFGQTFARPHDILWRHAGETGEAYLPVGSQAFIARGG